MELQSNPYLMWQLVPGFLTLLIGLAVQVRTPGRRGTRTFCLLMYAGSLWAFANAVQLVSPDPAWQRSWNTVLYGAVMVVPTAWFLLATRITGIGDSVVARLGGRIWAPAALFYLSLVTNGLHGLFFSGSRMVTAAGHVAVDRSYGPLFAAHTAYSYALIMGGVVLVLVWVARDLRDDARRAVPLVIGILAPLVGNAYYLLGSLPPAFPDPTPIMFTITGSAFGWAVFGGRILDVVPIAYQELARRLSTGVIVVGRDSRIVDLNPAAALMLDTVPERLRGLAVDEALAAHPELRAAIAGATTGQGAAELRTQVALIPDSSVVELTVSAIGAGLETDRGWLIQLVDATEAVRARADLATTREAFDSVLDTLQDSYFEADPSGIVTYANRAFYENLGLADRSEVIGRNFRRFTDRRSIRRLYRRFGELYRTAAPVPRFEYLYRPLDAEPRRGEMSISPVLRDGVVIGSRGLIRDISERIRSEELLRDAKNAAEAQAARLRAINRVAATVSRTLDLDEVLQSVCEELASIFPVRNAGVALLTPDRESLEVVAFFSPYPEEQSALGMILPFTGNPASQEVVRTGKPLVMKNAQTDPRSGALSEISRTRGTRAIMIVPILSRGKAIGTIGMPAVDPDYEFTDGEVELAETIATHLAAAVDNATTHTMTESALNVAERDLEIGREIQSGFFPERLPRIHGWEIAAEFRAARQVAGDFYDAFTVPGTRYLALVIADVCDKGVGAALFMVLFRSLIRAFAAQLGPDADANDSLRRILRSTNDYIADYHGRSNMFATVFLGLLDPETGEVAYVNGGHEPPVVIDRNGAVARRLEPTGPAVGMLPGVEYAVVQFELAPGDCLVGFTDGTTDAKSAAGGRFTEERLLRLLAYPWTSIHSMLFELNLDLRRHIGSEPQFDDITLIALRRKVHADEHSRHAVCREARMEALPELREFVESSARHCGLRDDDVFAFKSSADEICTNIVQHGYRGREPGLLALEFHVEPGLRATLRISDDGMHFPPERAREPDLSADWTSRDEGGLGLYLVRAQMDRLSYRRAGNDTRNELVLEKDLSAYEHSEGG